MVRIETNVNLHKIGRFTCKLILEDDLGFTWILDLRWIGNTEHAKCPER